MPDFLKDLSHRTNFRLGIMLAVIVVCFFILVCKLFNLQIIMGEFLQNQITGTTLREITVPAQRGSIYDRYGRPLAVNNSSFTVNIDPSVTVDNLNDVLLRLTNLLEENGEEIVDEFPISKEKPYEFLFDGSVTQETRWKKDMNLDENLTAEEAFYALKNKEDFEIDPNLSDEDVRKILSLRCEMYMKRYSKFIPLVVAYNIKKETIGAIEEEKSEFPNVYVDVDALRVYPTSELFSHILGYIRIITEGELALYADYDYSQTDIIGKDGIEKAFELELNGVDGINLVEVDSTGRRISTIEDGSVPSIAGNNVFLTVDADLQKVAYDALENQLKETIINRMTGKSKDFPYTLKQVLMSMAESNNIPIEGILSSQEGSNSYTIRQYILGVDNTAETDTDLAKQIFSDGIDRDSISVNTVMLAMYEQGVYSADTEELNKLKNGTISALTLFVNKMNSGDITPQMTNMDPCTGSVVVTDVQSGDVLASVTYPSYDNNRFVNNFDNAYYKRLQEDPTTPLVNRPFNEPRAPGSTFKMITATAGLEEGIIKPSTTIHDNGTFTDAGKPYARCWIGNGLGSHGSINVAKALEVSCNYFFYELSYRMGNSSNGKTLEGIQMLNKYMKLYGLDDPTGVEIYELYKSRDEGVPNISSPEYKRYIYSLRNEDADESELRWYDGETIRTAIGQAYNNYTAATLTKYIATLANGGTRYSMHFLNSIHSSDGTLLKKYEPNVETELNLKSDTLNAIYQGMYQVTTGENGTLRNVFKDYPIKIAAKSGTAQQSSYRSEHTIFVGFAPLDDPQIAITVLIPFGSDSVTAPAPNVAKTVISDYLKVDFQPQKAQFNTISE